MKGVSHLFYRKENAPCQGCPSHKGGCHADCDDYKAWKKKAEKAKKMIDVERKADVYTVEAMKSIQRKNAIHSIILTKRK